MDDRGAVLTEYALLTSATLAIFYTAGQLILTGTGWGFNNILTAGMSAQFARIAAIVALPIP